MAPIARPSHDRVPCSLRCQGLRSLLDSILVHILCYNGGRGDCMAEAAEQTSKARAGKFFAAYPDDSGLLPLIQKLIAVISEEYHLAPHDWKRPAAGFGWHPQLFEALRQSALVVAICNDPRIGNRINPNVAFEAGFAFALGKPLLLLCEDASQMSADLAANQYLPFNRANIDDHSFDLALRRMLSAKMQPATPATRLYFYSSEELATFREAITFLVKLVHSLTQVSVYASKASVDYSHPSERQTSADIVSHYMFCVKADGTFHFLDNAPAAFSGLTHRIRNLNDKRDFSTLADDVQFPTLLDSVRSSHSLLAQYTIDVSRQQMYESHIHSLVQHSKGALPLSIKYLNALLRQAGIFLSKSEDQL